MKSLERLISCMVTELSDHANMMTDAQFLDAIRVYDSRAQIIINSTGGDSFWEKLSQYSVVRAEYLLERQVLTGFAI